MAIRTTLGMLIALALSACISRPAPTPPPSPTTSRVPDVIGVLVEWDWNECFPGVFTLDTGDVLRINEVSGSCGETEYVPTPRLNGTEMLLRGDPGHRQTDEELIFYGEDELGAWYAVAHRKSHEDEDRPCPWTLDGGAYIDEDVVHFSSGLVLPAGWLSSPSDIRGRQYACVDREGVVIEVQVTPTGH